ncbi:MAG: hypothetical protein MZW92_70075 [Comamonadaceae bacterium]|nr:hypothetical protein [Comamonadaceae bacterium]
MILRMKSLRPGRGRGLPVPRAAAEPRRSPTATQLLAELGAVDEANELTPIGRELAQAAAGPAHRPHDPGGARAPGAAPRCWSSPSALSVQDVRDRPLERAAGGRRGAQRSSTTSSSEFMRLRSSCGTGSRTAAASGTQRAVEATSSPTASRSSACASSFVSPRRVREWRDIHSQLHTVVAEHGWRLNDARRPPTSRSTCALLAGLLGNIGCKSDDDELVPRRARHQVLAPPGRAPGEEAGPLDRGGRTGRDHAPVRPRHRGASSRSGSSRWPATC